MYQQWLDGDEDVLKKPQDEDPFWEPTEDVLIGTANVFLMGLSYCMGNEVEKFTVTDYKGQEEGVLTISIDPCNQNGSFLGDDAYVDSPDDLLGHPLHFKVSI